MIDPEMRFYFFLALSLGRTVGELLSTMSAAELKGWQAYYLHEPWGEVRDDYRQAYIGSAICASMGAKVSPKDLVINWQHDEQEDQRLQAIRFRAWVESHNKSLEDNGRK